MKRMFQRLHRFVSALSISTKIIVIIVGLLCLPFLAFGVVWFQMSTETIEANAREVNRELVRQTSAQLDSYFTDLERSTFPMVSNPLIQQFMNLQAGDTLGLLDVRTRIESSLLPTLFAGRADIYGFSIASRNGVFSNYGNSARERAAQLLSMDDQTDREPYKVIGLTVDKSNLIVTVLRRFWDSQRYITPGFLMFDLNLNQITRIVNNIQLGKTGKIALIDASGLYVYHSNQELMGQPIPYADRAQLMNKPEGYFVKGDGKEEILTVFHRSTLNNWVMVSEVPMRELVGNLIGLRNVSIWVGLALIVFVLAVLGGFSIYLSRSLQLLQRLMVRAENGDLAVRAPERSNDEIGRVNRSFNKMVGEIRRLIEVVHTAQLKEKELQLKEREAVVMAMQSQINPHFLYNTLEVINSYALVEGVIPISNMTTALSDLFRYSVGSPNEIVSLREEIVHLRSYFEIQKERYRALEVELGTNDRDTGSVQAVRLLIQPLVENAFIHGYERHKLRPSYIGIRGEVGGEAYVLTIADKGGGMPADKLERYNRLFAGGDSRDAGASSDASNEAGAGVSDGKGIGLWNVHQRIRLLFGAPYGLFILKSDSAGTVIQVTLPYRQDWR
ncbi:cache domain-containing sensor histidine kinase [Paenibacillus koleovorans]|uniref:cache domain-containing sensor histidine kinase n=1 Tax=Paenibacillus koleovorans TaxID=121608 RepID=UPI000FD8D292|nr:sensor histidine kinase [Paenibacillus koleovorans]